MTSAGEPRHGAKRDLVSGCKRGQKLRVGRGGVILAFLAALAVVLTPTASANPPSSGIKQYSLCLQLASAGGTCDPSIPSSVPGGSTVELTLTITNDPSSAQSLGSMNFDAPVSLPIDTTVDPTASPPIDHTPTMAPGSAGSVTYSSTSSTATGPIGGELQIRNLNLATGATAYVNFWVKTPCVYSGTIDWPAPAAKQSNQFNGSGNDFQTPSVLPTSSIAAGGCNLAWLVQPAPANTDSQITGQAYDPTGVGVGYVAVAAVPSGCTTIDASAGCAVITSLSGLSVTLGQHQGSTDGGFTGTTATMQNGVATFGSASLNGLMGANEGTDYTLVASASGFNDSPDSSAFLLGSGVACSYSSCPSFTTSFNDGTTVQSSASGANFGFLAVLPADSYPSDVFSSTGGCAYWQPLGATGFEAYAGGSGPGGIQYFTYKIPWNLVVASTNNGVSQEPICARTPEAEGTWTSKVLNPDGSFSNSLTNAKLYDGYYYGILPLSPRDHVASNNPQVLSWTRVTGDGDYYYVSVGYPWDFGMRG